MGPVADVVPWWDPTIAQSPPANGFLFVGRPAGQYVDECIYRFSAGAAPESLFCPTRTSNSSRVQFVASESPRAGAASFIVVVEQNVTDVWPHEIYRVAVADGQATKLDDIPSDPLFGEHRAIADVRSVDEQRYAALVEREFRPELYVTSGAIGSSPGLPIGGEFASIRGLMSTGQIVVASINSGGGIRLVDPTNPLAVSTERLAVWCGDLAPGGEAVSFAEGGGFGQPGFVGVLDPTGEKRRQVGDDPFATSGFIDAGRLLIQTEASYGEWMIASDGFTPLVYPGYSARGSFRRVSGALAFVATTPSNDGGLSRGVGWYRDGSLAPACGQLANLRTLEVVSGETTPVVLLDVLDSSDYPSLGTIYSCRPGGDPVDLLAPHGLEGHLLTASSDFFD